MNYVNLTPHSIVMNDGRVFEPSGLTVRVDIEYSDIVDDIAATTVGSVSGLPDAAEGTRYIVSAMVLASLAGTRSDVVAPATGHPLCIRNDKGHIVSVPCFVS